MSFHSNKKLIFLLLNMLFGSLTSAQLLTFDLSNEAATGCANFMNNGVYAFDTFYWDGTSSSSATAENMTSVTDMADLTYESTTFTLSYYKYINVVDPNGDPLQSGERGDYRIYAGGTITIKESGTTKLTLINCITTNKVSWPASLDGPGNDVQGSGWGTIDEGNSDAAWVSEFDANGTGQIYIEYSSISPVVQNSCGSVSRYDFTVNFYPSSFNRSIVSQKVNVTALVAGDDKLTGKENKIATVVDMSGINLSFDFSSATNGGQASDKNDLYAEFRTDAPGGSAPTGVNTVGSDGYWDIGTTFSSFSTSVTFDLSSYTGISDINNIVMLRRETENADWEEYATQSISGNTITCTGVTAFSQWAPGSKGGDALPVELTSFEGTAGEEAVLLEWETATEVNNYGFEIQRSALSAERQAWQRIGFIQGHGTTNSPKQYSFTDPLDHILNHNLNRIDYRLKQIDNDGTFEYSKVVTVDLTTITSVNDNIEYTFSLEQNYPNPFNPTTTIKFTVPDGRRSGASSYNTKLVVYDLLGREVATLVNQKLQPGNHEVNFDAGSFSSGVYFYKLQTDNGFSAIKKLVLLK